MSEENRLFDDKGRLCENMDLTRWLHRKYLSVEDLKNCRLVAKGWSEVVVGLAEKCLIRIPVGIERIPPWAKYVKFEQKFYLYEDEYPVVLSQAAVLKNVEYIKVTLRGASPLRYFKPGTVRDRWDVTLYDVEEIPPQLNLDFLIGLDVYYCNWYPPIGALPAHLRYFSFRGDVDLQPMLDALPQLVNLRTLRLESWFVARSPYQLDIGPLLKLERLTLVGTDDCRIVSSSNNNSAANLIVVLGGTNRLLEFPFPLKNLVRTEYCRVAQEILTSVAIYFHVGELDDDDDDDIPPPLLEPVYCPNATTVLLIDILHTDFDRFHFPAADRVFPLNISRGEHPPNIPNSLLELLEDARDST